MNDLRISITVLITYIIAVLGIANIDRFQESFLDFSPTFFIVIAIVVFSELILVGYLIRIGVRVSSYITMFFWVVVYIIIEIYYSNREVSLEVHIIQVLLIVLASVLAYEVGKRIGEVHKALEGLSSSAYPNRVREIESARDLIVAEITRSRRYHHPLSVLTIRLEMPKKKVEALKEIDSLAVDMIERFAIAKASKIFSDLARSTDIILQDVNGQFVLLCPETNLSSINILAGRMEAAVQEGLNATIAWGGASFPDEALTFEDLLQVARGRYKHSDELN